MVKVGDRIGAIQKADEKTVHLFGYGVYDGEFVPDEDGFLKQNGITNPRFTLDDGSIMWGYKCWWGPEAQIQEMISERKVILVNPEDLENVD